MKIIRFRFHVSDNSVERIICTAFEAKLLRFRSRSYEIDMC